MGKRSSAESHARDLPHLKSRKGPCLARVAGSKLLERLCFCEVASRRGRSPVFRLRRSVAATQRENWPKAKSAGSSCRPLQSDGPGKEDVILEIHMQMHILFKRLQALKSFSVG
jgi:hypothetical protein